MPGVVSNHAIVAVPSEAGHVVSDKLFVKARLGPTRLITSLRPVARRIRREEFVDEEQFVPQQAKFKLGVSQDEPA